MKRLIIASGSIIAIMIVIGVVQAASTINLAAVNVAPTLIDAIGTRSTTWKGTVYGNCFGEKKFNKIPLTVTFKPSSKTTGKWTSSPMSTFQLVSCTGGGAFPEGTYSGSYTIVEGKAMYTTDAKYKNTKAMAASTMIPVLYSTTEMRLTSAGGSVPSPFNVIKRQ